MANIDYKKYKTEKVLYDNKVFSYHNTELVERNYSRKNFANTFSKLVVFNNCIFEQTILREAKFENCLFQNCIFLNSEFLKVVFKDVSFVSCKFSDLLFNKCKYESVKFENNEFENVSMFPYFNIENFCVAKVKKNSISTSVNDVLEKAKLQKFIRESNTIFKKFRNTWPKNVKRQMKKIKKKDGDKLGLSKKERLAENTRRKKERNKLQLKNYHDSQLGKNRKIDKGVLDFLLMKYSEKELIKGINYAIKNIDFSFHELSFLLKYIDKANKI